jgi:hypothetical protein
MSIEDNSEESVLYTETLQHIEPNEILRIKSTEDNG